MACPTCDHTMHGIPPLQWCPRCGTIKQDDRVFVPALVERVQLFQQYAVGPVRQKLDMLGITESIYCDAAE